MRDVALKSFDRLSANQDYCTSFIEELKAYFDMCKENPTFLKCYGITEDTNSKKNILVLEYAAQGSLRGNLISIARMKWKDKIAILQHIATDLQTIHSSNRIHRDLHGGNILQNSLHDAYVADLGLSISTNMAERSNRCGVPPYMAPEVLKNEPYTTASDIYSFGIIMWEMSAGKPNYQDNIDLICNGLRPKFSEDIPSPYIELANVCMKQIAYERPSVSDIQEVLNCWTKINYFVSIFKNADKKIDNFKVEHPTNFCENFIIKYSSISSKLKSLSIGTNDFS